MCWKMIAVKQIFIQIEVLGFGLNTTKPQESDTKVDILYYISKERSYFEKEVIYRRTQKQACVTIG